MNKFNERVLDDTYPVFWDYLYVADGVVIRSDIKGNIKDLKKDLQSQEISCKEIKNCDIDNRLKDKN